MKRGAMGGIAAAVLLAGGVFAWNAVRQEREFRRLIGAGDAALAKNQTFEAIEDFSGALALKRDSMLGYLKRGDSYRRRGELSAALRDLREASSVDPTATRPLELLGDVDIAMKRYDGAAEAFRRYLALDDGAPRVFYKLALAYYRGGQASLAIDPLRRAVALDGRLVEAHYLLGLCLEELKRDTEAIQELTRAVDISPAFDPAREELARIDLARGRARDGIEQLEALAALEPSRPQRMVDVALAYSRLGRTEQAIMTLGRAVDRFPESDVAYVTLGRTWLTAAETHHDRFALGKALEVLQPAASPAGASSETLTLYGRALFLSGDADASERTLEQATSRLPVDPASFLYLAEAAEERGHTSAAREALVKHLSLIDDDDQKRVASGRIADLSLRIGDPSAALVWAQRAMGHGHPDAPLLSVMADAQFRLGRIEAARALLSEGLERDPQNRTLLRLRRRIGN